MGKPVVVLYCVVWCCIIAVFQCRSTVAETEYNLGRFGLYLACNVNHFLISDAGLASTARGAKADVQMGRMAHIARRSVSAKMALNVPRSTALASVRLVGLALFVEASVPAATLVPIVSRTASAPCMPFVTDSMAHVGAQGNIKESIVPKVR